MGEVTTRVDGDRVGRHLDAAHVPIGRLDRRVQLQIPLALVGRVAIDDQVVHHPHLLATAEAPHHQFPAVALHVHADRQLDGAARHSAQRVTVLAAQRQLASVSLLQLLLVGLQRRPLRGVALMDDASRHAYLAKAHEQSGRYIRYTSSEAREHRCKATALRKLVPGPLRVCAGCSQEFQQRFASGRALYCTAKCRDQIYAAKKRRGGEPRQRDGYGRYI
ncbi:hypothetical protein ASC98_16775 [Rhizobacter sp. Root1238]|nr:hypothetical protein ASC98_16775 [Rhizobacter sp. Root1238]